MVTSHVTECGQPWYVRNQSCVIRGCGMSEISHVTLEDVVSHGMSKTGHVTLEGVVSPGMSETSHVTIKNAIVPM